MTDLGGVPRVLVWDEEGAVGRWRGGVSELTGDTEGSRGTPGSKVIICRPGDPEAKGVVERANGYLETSFLPGRTFTGWSAALRLPRDYYVRLDANDYSVHPEVIGRRIEVAADQHRVRVSCERRLVADHERIWAKHQTGSSPLRVVW